MRPGVVPNSISEFHSFPKSTLANIDAEEAGAFSGVSKDGRVCWIAKGATLEVLDIVNCHRLAAWKFGQVLGDQHTCVTCVEELSVPGQTRKLLVGVSTSSQNGLVCVFDVVLSKVVGAMELPQQVTEIAVVCTSLGNSIPRWALSEALRNFCGVIAVGCCTGHVHLIDLCLDETDYYSDEEIPAKVHFITPRTRDIEFQRSRCVSQGQHIAMQINDNFFVREGFQYSKPDGIVVKTFSQDVVSVTCLKYMPQIGILAVGFSFGCYQLWKLNVPVLEYSSRLESIPLPVSHFAYQEPENDPKNFCYIWVARGLPLSQDDPGQEASSSLCLYQLSFTRKAFYSNYGVFYEELTSICLRMDHELGSGISPLHPGSDECSGILACYTLTDQHYQPASRLNEDDSFEDGHGADLSLCVFVWESSKGSNSGKTEKHLAIFDLNRWYQAQMPSVVRHGGGSMDTCPYLAVCQLDSAAEKSGADIILMCHVDADSVRKFVSTSPMPPEQHFYPASLAFNMNMITETGIVQANFLGSQQQVLANMKSKGAMCLLMPQDLYSVSVYMGLVPRPIGLAYTHQTPQQQRESLLSLALEHNMLGFIRSCVVRWSTGEYEHQGCTLKFLLDWAWEKVSAMKHQIDTTCTNLYNWSGLQLDKRGLQVLQQTQQKLSHLISLFRYMSRQTSPITEQGLRDLQSKTHVTSLLLQHLTMVLWFLEVGLLPENDDAADLMGNQYSYPAGNLIQLYKNKRAELLGLHTDVDAKDLLMIDGLVEHLGVADLWEREGGNGLYPPPSFHAVLSVYLQENVDSMSRHCLVLYLLLDLMSLDSTAEDSQFSERITQFTKKINMPQTLVKLVMGFWLLDHKDFEEALTVLLDPLVSADYSRWQHKRIIKALLYQGDSKMALRYIQSRKPPLCTPDEVKLKLTVLLANGMTSEALEYQRLCQDKTWKHDLLFHLFLGCQQTKTLDSLLQLPLTTEEEQLLVEYMMTSTETYMQELLVMYYLQRARFVEAIQLNEKLKHSNLIEVSSAARERAVARNAIVDSFATILPSVQRKLLFEQIHVPKKTTAWRREVRRPKPLSTKITKRAGTVMSQSAFIMSIMDKVEEIQYEEEDEDEANTTHVKSVGPFICTPVTPVRKAPKSTQSVVYPEVKDTETLNQSVFSKSLYQPSPGAETRRQRYFSVDCLSVLKTPTILKQTPKKRFSGVNILTPQSILKVRNLISSVSPSPHSAGTTPNTAELESSAKRSLSRKLGYSLAGSQPGTPRSVSFADPSVNTSGKFKHRISTSSQPGTPKSVSFAENQPRPEDSIAMEVTTSTTFTPGRRQELATGSSQPSTPKSVTFATMGKSVSQLNPGSTPKQLRFATSSTTSSTSRRTRKSVSPGSPRSVKDRSPTPESSNLSPRFASKVDTLIRPPLHESPVSSEDLDLQQELSDEEVEEMEAEGSNEAQPLRVDTDITSTSRERSSNSNSPVKLSPGCTSTSTVKISRSPVSTYSPTKVQTDQTDAGTPPRPDLIEEEMEDNMEVDEINVSSSSPSSPEQRIRSRVGMAGEPIIEEEVEEEEDQKPSQSQLSPRVPFRPAGQGENVFHTPPPPVRHLVPPTPPDSVIESPVKQGTSLRVSPRRSMSPASRTAVSPVKQEKITPEQSPEKEIVTTNISGGETSPKVEPEHVSVSPGQSSSRGRRSKSREKTPKLELEQEMEEEVTVTPSRPARGRRAAAKTEADDLTLTPTRSSKSKDAGVVTPTRSSRRTQKSDQDQSVVLTPTPTRSSRRLKAKKEESPVRSGESGTEEKENTTTPAVTTPTRRGRKPKQPAGPVPSSSTSKSPEMTRIKSKSRSSASPSHNGSESTAAPLTPTRVSSRLRDRKDSESVDDDAEPAMEVSIRLLPSPSRKQTGPRPTLSMALIDSQLPDDEEQKSPSRGRPKKSSVSRSPGRSSNKSEEVEVKVQTPTRGRKKMVDKSQKSPSLSKSPENVGRQNSHSPKGRKASPEKVQTPTRGRRKTIDTSTKSPSRSKSPKTGNRQKSHSPKARSSSSPEKIQTPTRGRRKAVSKTTESPSRSKSPTDSRLKSQSPKASPEKVQTPTRGGRKKPDSEKAPTPTRGTARKIKMNRDSESEISPTRQSAAEVDDIGEPSVIPEDVNQNAAVSPARRSLGRRSSVRISISRIDKSTKEEPESSVKLTPSRQKRAKKEESEVSSTLSQQPGVYDILGGNMSSSFQFSDPMEVELTEEPVPKAFTPVKSFLFSPPITRTKLKVSEKESEPANILLPAGPTETSVAEAKATSRKRTRNIKKLYTDEIMLLPDSPFDVKYNDDEEEGLSVITRGHNTRSATIKKDGNKIFLTTVGEKKKRTTSRRFGPVKKKI